MYCSLYYICYWLRLQKHFCTFSFYIAMPTVNLTCIPIEIQKYRSGFYFQNHCYVLYSVGVIAGLLLWQLQQLSPSNLYQLGCRSPECWPGQPAAQFPVLSYPGVSTEATANLWTPLHNGRGSHPSMQWTGMDLNPALFFSLSLRDLLLPVF